MQDNALILLSTYNGAQFLTEQLHSLRSQTHTNWHCLIRDDGSQDETLDIINHFLQTDNRISFIKDDLGNLNAKKSFSALMEHALTRHESYIFFCDQDDIWLPHKLERSIEHLQTLEAKYNATIPALVHSDLTVVDRTLQTIHPSYIAYEKLRRPATNPLRTLIVNNYITGCTIGMNRALLTLACPVPDDVFMHDWWCAVCAAACGNISFIPDSTILYRQHAGNSVGSKGLAGKLAEFKSLKRNLTRRSQHLRTCFTQAKELENKIRLLSRTQDTVYGQARQSPPAYIAQAKIQLPFINHFATLNSRNKFSRYLSAAKLGLRPAGKMRIVAFYVMLGLV